MTSRRARPIAPDGPVRVGVLGAGTWATAAHLPGWARDPRVQLVAIADPVGDLAERAAERFGIPHWSRDHRDVIGRDDVAVIDVCTPSATHATLSEAALEAGHHVLCEKPVAYDFRETDRLAAMAEAQGSKTKLGFTFRHAPAMRQLRRLVDEGWVGTPFIFNGYEQNSQFLDPMNPLRQQDPDADPSVLQVASLEGYGAPIIDIGAWLVGAPYAEVVGTMRNFIPERMVRLTGRLQRMNIDDGDIFLAEFGNGAIGSVQTSFVTVGNYPGIEARLYGREGALICRLVEERGICELLHGARPDAVEFSPVPVPADCYPAGGTPAESWRTLFYANLIKDFLDELTGVVEKNEGNFRDGARVQEVINAVEASHRQRRWVSLPL